MLLHLTLQRGPIHIQEDFRELICMSNKLSSTWHAFTSCSKLQTKGAIIKLSSAYNFTKQRWLTGNWLTMSFKYTANNCGESTEPWRTSNLIWIKSDVILFHFIQVQQFENQFSNIHSSVFGMRLCINLMYSAWWLTLSKALVKFRAHRFTVLPLLIKRFTVLRMV